MYRNAIKYGVYGWLAPGSDAYEMYQNKKWAELKAHLIKLDEAKHILEGATPEEAKAHTRELNRIQAEEKTKRVLETIMAIPPEVSDAPVQVGTICYDDSELLERKNEQE